MADLSDLLVVGGALGVLFLISKQHSQNLIQPQQGNTTQQPSTNTQTQPIDNTPIISSGGGGGGFDVSNGGGLDSYYLVGNGGGYDIFDLLDMYARDTAPSYSDEYKYAPAVIDVRDLYNT